MLFGFIFGVTVLMISILAYVLCISFMLWMVVDAAKNDKFWWIVLIVALPLVGAVVYYFVEKHHDYAKLPADQTSPEVHHKVEHKHEEKKDETIKLAEGEKKD
jgi:uncharacterized membrane protein YeiB